MKKKNNIKKIPPSPPPLPPLKKKITTASFIVGSTSSGLHIRPYSKVQTLSWNPISKLGFSKQKDQSCFWSNSLVQCRIKNTRNFVVYASSVPEVSLPSGPPSNSIRSLILGMVVSIVLPFFTHKLDRIENAVEQVEQIVEVVEKVAEEVDKIADDIMDDLPEGQLKNMVNYIEDMAEKTAKNADSIGDLIDKVQEAEDKLESFVESLDDDEAKESPTEAN